jgi:hypothetical protein
MSTLAARQIAAFIPHLSTEPVDEMEPMSTCRVPGAPFSEVSRNLHGSDLEQLETISRRA